MIDPIESARIRAVVAEQRAAAERAREPDALAALRAAIDPERLGECTTIDAAAREAVRELAERDARIAHLTEGLATAQREAARLRGCAAVEGDLVCGHEAHAQDMERRLADAQARLQVAEARLEAVARAAGDLPGAHMCSAHIVHTVHVDEVPCARCGSILVGGFCPSCDAAAQAPGETHERGRAVDAGIPGRHVFVLPRRVGR